ncbi:hypothetical protein Q1695_002010 [Nippostrongylus brasiliensis]|nr:hypothetical protein Q1695_002010 [Nippostrongylus brasiliensis]
MPSAESAGSHCAGGENGVDLSKAETEVYDRQIRLWGLQAQKKLHAASGLLFGLSGVGAEITKNLMLCGLRSLTLADDRAVDNDDFESNFLLERDSLGKNRAEASSPKAQALNPMVKLEVMNTDLKSLSLDFVSQFTLLVLCDQSYEDVVLWNDRCRQLNVGFIACSVFGWMGYSFFDFNDHRFLSPKLKIDVCNEDASGTSSGPRPIDLESEDAMEMKAEKYPRFDDAFNVDWSRKQLIRKSKRLLPSSYFPLKAMLKAQREKKLTDDEDKNVGILTELWTSEVLSANRELEQQSVQPEKFDYFFGPQLSPVCAVVGGLAGQEAIKAMSENGTPLKNVFIYSALDSSGTVCHLPPQL